MRTPIHPAFPRTLLLSGCANPLHRRRYVTLLKVVAEAELRAIVLLLDQLTRHNALCAGGARDREVDPELNFRSAASCSLGRRARGRCHQVVVGTIPTSGRGARQGQRIGGLVVDSC